MVVVVVVEVVADGDEITGIVGTTGADVATLPTVGDTPSVGTAAAELTPRLPISVDPNGIPVRALPPGVVGDVDVGVDDEAILPEPEPHIPDIPAVSGIPEVVDVPGDIDVAMVPDIAEVAAVAVPAAIPPPSNVAVDPDTPEGDVPRVEHVVPMPGIALVPMGDGLIPGDAISVAPSGIPVPPTDEPEPSGDVMPIEGVAVTAPTWANAGLQHNKGSATAAVRNDFMDDSPI
jgi:hypothetical protein